MNAAARGRSAWLVGGGIASLAAATYLLRDGGFAGAQIRILEADRPGGALDAGGSAEAGYSMPGSRMFGPAYVLMYELLDGIPSLDDPAKSVAEDIFDFWQSTPWFDRARLVGRGGAIAEAADWGLRHRDRADLVALMVQDEARLDGLRIDESFDAGFFDSHFWWMWASMFGFETWHSAAELRRYLLRFLRLFPDLESMQIIQSTRYCGRDSIVRPMVDWLTAQGVAIESGVEVTDIEFASAGAAQRPVRLAVRRGGADETIELAPSDLVIATLGSLTAGASLGSMEAPPLPLPRPGPAPAWALWQRLAQRLPGLGRPEVFCEPVDRTRWITFTVTDRDDRFFRRVESMSGSPAGQGGLVTLKDSPWGLTFHLYPMPAYQGQPADRFVWWGYGLFPDRVGDFAGKPMADCSGREILAEVYGQLGWQDEASGWLEAATCIPCLLPHTTSQFMPRRTGDRPDVTPAGTTGFAVVGQFCEIPDDVVYTVEYSVHAARIAVTRLLGLPDTMPATYRGLEHPNALVEALRRILQ